MENIRDLIFNEFNNNGYIEVNGCKKSLFKHSVYTDYWVIVSSIHDFYEQKELFEELRGIGNIEKNVSMLILHDVSDSLGDREVVEIENNPYWFKKYIVDYSAETVAKLISLMKERKVRSVKELIMDEESFNSFCMEIGNGPYSLLYTIIHKLPFIPIEVKNKVVDLSGITRIEETDLFKNVMSFPSGKEEVVSAIVNFLDFNSNE